MNAETGNREARDTPRWADAIPLRERRAVSRHSTDIPRFSRIARSYLVHIGGLDWKKINPDIFGSMIQAVAEDEERGALGMHYTSVPNILKVLNPLYFSTIFERNWRNRDPTPGKLLNLRNRIATNPGLRSGLRIGQFPCHRLQGNAARSNPRSTAVGTRAAVVSDIPLTNSRGIEVRDFPGRDCPPRPHHRGVPVRRNLPGAAGSAEGLPPARRHELDRLRQCAQARLAEALSAPLALA